MDIIPPALIETGENDAVPEEKTPLQMAQESHECASVGWTKREIAISDEKHRKNCPALKSIRSLRAYLLVGIGFIFSASMFGTVTIKSALRTDRLELKDEFRAILREEIAKVAENDEPTPAPVASPSVTPDPPAMASQPKPRKVASVARSTHGGGFHWLNPLNYVQAAE